MAERRKSDSPRGGLRRVTGWSAVGGYVLDWTLALGVIAFASLASGLVGGITGGFIDAALAFIQNEWVGYGRMLGWTTGAVGTVIGMPLGWARSDDKKWSLPSPSKLRKKISAKTRKRRKKPSREFRTMGDIFKGAAALGLVGGILGFALGGALLMSWFSLAMSPLASTEWFQLIEFASAREFYEDARSGHEDRDGTVIATDDPVAMYLFFSPLLILGAAGAVIGMAYGVMQYVGYLVNVPADVRERERREQRKPVVEEREAIAAAINQRLRPLAPAPRAVPSAVKWQLLREGVGAAFVFGAIFITTGVLASVLLFTGWRSDPAKFPLVAVSFGLIFISLGSLFLIASVRAWQGKIRILRHGHLARCRLMTCRHPQKGVWRSYSKVLDELRAAWDKPLADFNVKADTKGFERFGMLFGIAAIVVFGFMGTVGLALTAVSLYLALVHGERIAWAAFGFVVLWWAFIVGLGRLFWQKTRVVTTIGRQSLKTLGIEPIVDCRVEFELPGGKTVKAKAKVDLAPRLAPGKPGPDDLIAYNPWKPDNALLLSGFTPKLDVDENGRWRFADAT
jgi:hypothetical protein